MKPIRKGTMCISQNHFSEEEINSQSTVSPGQLTISASMPYSVENIFCSTNGPKQSMVTTIAQTRVMRGSDDMTTTTNVKATLVDVIDNLTHRNQSFHIQEKFQKMADDTDPSDWLSLYVIDRVADVFITFTTEQILSAFRKLFYLQISYRAHFGKYKLHHCGLFVFLPLVYIYVYHKYILTL